MCRGSSLCEMYVVIAKGLGPQKVVVAKVAGVLTPDPHTMSWGYRGPTLLFGSLVHTFWYIYVTCVSW